MKITKILSCALKDRASLTHDEYQTLVDYLNSRLSMSHITNQLLTPDEARLIAILPEFEPVADDEMYLADHIDDREWIAHEYGYDIGNRSELLQSLHHRLHAEVAIDEVEAAMLTNILGIPAINLQTIEKLMADAPLSNLEAE